MTYFVLFYAEVLNVLIQWMLEGLDGAKATAQPESTYKVRHMKMGFKVTAAMCTCDSDVALKVLVSIIAI